MSDNWTTHDDLIMEARARVKRVADSVPWTAGQEEHSCEHGTVITLHDPAAADPDVSVSWGFCAQVSARPDNDEVVMLASIGDRVRDGHEDALDRVIAEVNAEMVDTPCSDEYTVRPFRYVRDGDQVLLEARFRADEVTEDELYYIERDFERIMVNYIPDDLFEEHMEPLHFDDDPDCGCDACEDLSPSA